MRNLDYEAGFELGSATEKGKWKNRIDHIVGASFLIGILFGSFI